MIDIARITEPQRAELERIAAAGEHGAGYSASAHNIRMQLKTLGLVTSKPVANVSVWMLTLSGADAVAELRKPTTLGNAVRKARGGDAPRNFRGFA